MDVRQEIQRDAVDGADAWIDAHSKGGVDHLSVIREVQKYIKHMNKLTDAGTDAIMVRRHMFTKMSVMAMLGRHVLVTRLLERGEISERDLYPGERREG